MTSPLRKLLADGPKTGLLAARAISNLHATAFESELSKIFSSRVRVESWLAQVRVDSQELSSHCESLVCNLESNEISHFSMTLLCYLNGTRYVRKWCLKCYETAPDKLENCAQCWFSKLIAGYLYLHFFSLHFTCLFHSQSFQQV